MGGSIVSDPKDDDKYRWLTDTDPFPAYTRKDYKDLAAQAVKSFDYGCIEDRIKAAADRMRNNGFKLKQDALDSLMLERDGQGIWVPEGSVTGRMNISPPNPQPRPQFKWQTGPALCGCPLCQQIVRSTSGDDVSTPYHPAALIHANKVRQHNARLAEEEYYARQAEEEIRRNLEMTRDYRVKFRGRPNRRNVIW
jgi:hypothetical protein